MGADVADVAIYIYIVMWLEHHGNRLCGLIRLRRKKCDWMGDGIPLR